MKHRLSTRLLALGIALSAIGSAAALVSPAHGGTTAKGAAYWPPLTIRGTAHAGKGVYQSMLGLTAANGKKVERAAPAPGTGGGYSYGGGKYVAP